MCFDYEQARQHLQPYFGERLRCHESLADHSAFAVGGPADIWVSLETAEEVTRLVQLCAEKHWPLLLIGGGRNVLFADGGVRGIVAQINTHHYTLEEQEDGTALVTVEAGMPWQQLLEQMVSQGWGGLEFGIGIPGTLGAGIISNAGAHSKSLSQLVESIEVLDARGCNQSSEDEYAPPIRCHYQHEELDFGYRHSRFQVGRSPSITAQGQLLAPARHLIEPEEIVLQVVLRLHRQAPHLLQSQSASYLQERRKYEPDYPHTGPIFKDSSEYKVADLIARTGLQSKRVGQAQIMEHNANYIANLGGATGTDIGLLMVEAYQRVYRQFGIALLINVDLQGDWSNVDLQADWRTETTDASARV